MSTQVSAAVAQGETSGASAPTEWPARYARFGQFHVDFLKEELYCNGARCRIQSKVFQALLVLLSRPGDIVTRGEVRDRLWPDSVQVNFDANVNTAMNKLRLVLGDTPESSLYIETVPRRGYSFTAKVEFSHQPLTTQPQRPNASEAAKIGGRAASSLLFRWLPAPVRPLSFVLAGILLGVLLVLAWNFLAGKSHRSQNLGRQSASLSAQHTHKMQL